METQSLIQNIKQEIDYEEDLTMYSETDRNMETQSLIQNIKEEPDYESQTVKDEPNDEEESDMSAAIKKSPTNSPSPSSPEENSFLYCEKCQMKYEGGCPDHGAVSYLDNVEEGQGEDYSQDDSTHVPVIDYKGRQELGREKVEQSNVYQPHSDDVRTLPKRDSSIESDEMFSVCDMNTEPCVAGTSCGSQSNEIKIVKPCTCDVCGKGFSYSSQLKTHKRIHTGEKPYKCDVCGDKFAQSEHLKSHNRIHTGEKPYKCELCGLAFTHQGNLKTHRRTHTGEKPYECEVCGVRYSHCSSLKIHKRTHTGEKPYKCDVCGFRFVQSGMIKEHMRIHTGEKPYKCDVCGVGFSKSCNLNKHKRTHTG